MVELRLQGKTSINQQIDLSDMESGVYFIQFENGAPQRVVKW